MANKHMKKSLMIKKMQITNAVRYHYVPTRMSVNKKRLTIPTVGEA